VDATITSTGAGETSNHRDEDRGLAERVRVGDSAAIEHFCVTFGQAVARYARRFQANLSAEEIEDITQTVLISAVEGIDTFKQYSSLKTWVLRIAHHKLVDAVRRSTSRERRERVFAEMPDEWEPEHPEEPHAAVLAKDQQQRVAAALGALPALERAVVSLRYIEDMDTVQIADIIHKSHRSTQALLTSARARLRAILGSEDPVE